MPTLTLPWYPPAPAAGPVSLLQLPPDDWALEPKIDGIRVIWLDGRPFVRQGGLLSASKGASRLSILLADIPHTLDGEWVPAWDAYFIFDLPDCSLDYDGRRLELAEIFNVTAPRVWSSNGDERRTRSTIVLASNVVTGLSAVLCGISQERISFRLVL